MAYHESVIPNSILLPQLVWNADLVRADGVDHYWVHRVRLCLLPDGDQREQHGRQHLLEPLPARIGGGPWKCLG